MNYRMIEYFKKDQIGAIILNRPESKNAINADLAQELIDVCALVDQDDVIRVVTVTGTGEAFCIGAESALPSGSLLKELLSVATAVARLRCPVIAAINGDALGQGLELALACDLRIAVETAYLGLPQITYDLIPWDGGTQRLPRLIGKAKAMEMILLGEPMSANEAYRVGLVNKVVERDELLPTVVDIARKMASSAPMALKYAKEAIDKGLELTLEQGLRLETDLYSLLQTTQDRAEGITAFQKKRKPNFKGK